MSIKTYQTYEIKPRIFLFKSSSLKHKGCLEKIIQHKIIPLILYHIYRYRTIYIDSITFVMYYGKMLLLLPFIYVTK